MTLAIEVAITFYPKQSTPFKVQKVSAIEIESSWKMLTDTASVVLPRNVADFDKQKVKELFAVGDKVVIQMGYNGELLQEFEGFITQVSADFPITISLSDAMWKLRQLPVNYVSAKASLKTFLTEVVKDYPLEVEDISLGGVRFSNTTLGDVLDKLQKDWSIYSFIRASKLTIAKPYSDVKVSGEMKHFDLERNCTENNLKYLSKEERTIKIIGTSSFGKGKRLQYEFGDENPKTTLKMTWHVSSQAELEKEVKRLYELHKREGFEGSFTTYGTPSVQHGEKIRLSSTLYPDRHGEYYVDRVKKSISNAQYRQEIEISGNAL